MALTNDTTYGVPESHPSLAVRSVHLEILNSFLWSTQSVEQPKEQQQHLNDGKTHLKKNLHANFENRLTAQMESRTHTGLAVTAETSGFQTCFPPPKPLLN